MNITPTPTSLSPAMQGYALGFIALSCFTAALFFLKFWRQSRDRLFLAFATMFVLEGINRTMMVFLDHPNEGSLPIYLLRMIGALIVLAAILRKNYARPAQ